jgi:hypothetical protein
MGPAAAPQRRRSTVETVVAATGFPLSARPPKATRVDAPRAKYSSSSSKQAALLDWHATAQEVRHLGATGLPKAAARNYRQEEYQRLTGRPPRKQAVPLAILRGKRQAAARREVRAVAAAREAGMPLPSASSSKQKKEHQKNRARTKNTRQHGPAPSIGFMKQGILQVKRQP